MPGVAVVTPTKGSGIAESGNAPAEEEIEEDGGDPEADYVTPCKRGSVARHAAELELTAFSAKVEALGLAADPKPLEEQLETLLDQPCFELAKADPKELLTFPNALSLRHWWGHGGSDWLWSYLRAGEQRYLKIAPTPRLALTLETAPNDHPLRPLLCPADESKPCAIESSGWARRTREKLELVGNRRRSVKDEVDCAEEAKKEPKAERYAAYRACLESGFERQETLPIGRFKAPSDGWLVMNDDSGGGCRHVHAFDLVTGSAYSADDCTGTTQTSVGRLPVGALREAMWMLVLAREAQHDVKNSQGFHVPEKIPIQRTRGETIGLGFISCSCGCGVSMQRSWSWMRDKNGTLRGQVSGVVRGQGDDAAIRHAFDLLEIASSAFEKGCAPASPPARVAWNAAGPSSREGEAAVLDDVESEPVRAALLKAKAPRTCTAKP